MLSRAKFSVAVSDEDRLAFAELSGDHNPLHVDAAYAAKTESKQCVLHGAFSAWLISRMAGMHLPGTECLLHGMRLRFIKPIHTPVELVVEGIVQRDDGENGEVVVTICEAVSGRLLVEGSYQFGRHTRINQKLAGIPVFSRKAGGVAGARVLVTGASGGLGAAMLTALGVRAIVPLERWELLDGPKKYPVAHQLTHHTVSLPVYPSLLEGDARKIASIAGSLI